ncbi:hypothetical protein Tco_1055593 [Tanacetum coccineum]|uniref:Tf2-1-like SH3-like domain-containing protein n=1 Tax=Tanacetum coccineum TaxID=301880 RepID=A0ABQ5H195_9ASTR
MGTQLDMSTAYPPRDKMVKAKRTFQTLYHASIKAAPFKIVERIGPVAYKLELLDKLRGIHNTFYVLNLKKCLADENLVIPLEEI